MRRQVRPFMVEVKQKRGRIKQSRSIRGDLDLSAVVDETTRKSEKEVPNRQLIDSHVIPIDAEDGNKLRAEHLMADPKEAESAQVQNQTPATGEAVVAKRKAPRPKAAKAQPARPVRKAAAKSVSVAADATVTVRKARKVYPEKERGQLLGQIKKAIARGESVKSATGQAGISEQTYYQWKKSAASALDSGDLKDLVVLEEENARLKKLLAERLRKENVELKKKLGLG